MPFVIRRSTNDDIDSMIRLILDTYANLSPKEWFVIDDEDYTREMLKTGRSWGYVAVDPQTDKLAGLFIVTFPGTADFSLGYDLPTPDGSPSVPSEAFLNSIAHMDTAVVSPDCRGHHLQRRLMEFAENELKAAGYTRLMATVHPDNRYSLGNGLALGYRVMTTKEKYGGYLRHVLLKEI